VSKQSEKPTAGVHPLQLYASCLKTTHLGSCQFHTDFYFLWVYSFSD